MSIVGIIDVKYVYHLTLTVVTWKKFEFELFIEAPSILLQ